MTNPIIPTEAIEAAALALWNRDKGMIATGGPTALPDRRAYMEEAHAILEAAAPFMLAEAWGEGYKQADSDAPHSIKTDNPYRSEA